MCRLYDRAGIELQGLGELREIVTAAWDSESVLPRTLAPAFVRRHLWTSLISSLRRPKLCCVRS
jgi:hypothetical protein